MTVYRLTEDIIFPPPEYGDPNGLLAVGGDLTPERLLLAYQMGIFPWFSEGDPILWWSPNPRLLVFPEKFKVSKSLRRNLRGSRFEVRFDTQFAQIIKNCADTPRFGQDGTWITSEIEKAYSNLHELGYAHSIEVYHQKELVGGLYGVSLGGCFFGESMFHHMPDASKVALGYLVALSKHWEFDFIDCQMTTPHLLSLGGEEVSREEFLSQLEQGLLKPTRVGKWDYLDQTRFLFPSSNSIK